MGADVSIILCSANEIRKRASCRDDLSRRFHIPQIWWTDHARKSNGYFGCEPKTDENGALSGMTSWVRFIVKMFDQKDYKNPYYWYKINMFVCWDKNRTVIFVFDAPERLRAQNKIVDIILADLKPQMLDDPFWMYPCVLDNVVEVQNEAVWDMRTQIRDKEKGRDSDAKRQDFGGLHDLARHAIHGIETLDVAVKTVAAMTQQHEICKEMFEPINEKPVRVPVRRQRRHYPVAAAHARGQKSRAFPMAHHRVHQRLLFFEDMLVSLRHRSSSNKERLLNEIQLLFNLVAQNDAGTSLQISKATRADSAAMRTIAFATLAFLPATFIAAIFSMSFFDNDDKTGWGVSGKFWLYWAIAIPVTVVTAGTWWWWQRVHWPKAKRSLSGGAGEVYEMQSRYGGA